VFLPSIGAGKIALVVAMPETAEQRKARIRQRLKDADTPQKEVSRNVEPPKEEPEAPNFGQWGLRENKSGGGGSDAPPPPSNSQIANRTLQRRRDNTANYKVHVITAIGLSILIRVAAMGPKAVIGGK